MHKFVSSALACVVSGVAIGAEPSSPDAPSDVPDHRRYGEWVSSELGGGGYLVNGVLCPSDPDRLYWYSDVGGAFRSDDRGKTWRMIHGTAPIKMQSIRSLIVDPRDADHLIAAAGSRWDPIAGVLVSRDGGASWERTLEAQFYGNEGNRMNGVVLARHPENPDVVLVASSLHGLHRSDDNGQTWRPLGMERLFVSDLEFDRTNGERVWLSARMSGTIYGQTLDEGFFRSDDGGESFTRLEGPIPTELLQDPVDPGVLYGIFDRSHVRVSRDGGETWDMLSDGLRLDVDGDHDSASGYRYSALGAGPDFILAGSGDGTVYRLDHGEQAWERVENREVNQGDWYGRRQEGHWDKFGRAMASIVVNPDDPDHWRFSDWYAIYESPDAGRTWNLTIDGVEMTVIHTVVQDPTRPGRVHMGMADNGYFRSEDGGATFQRSETKNNNVKSVTVIPQRPDRVVATGTTGGQWKAEKVLVSQDGGRRFDVAAMEGLPRERHLNTIAADPTSPDTLYVTVSGGVEDGSGGVYRSDDQGATWRWAGEGLPTGDPLFKGQIWDSGTALAISDDGSKVLISQPRRMLFRAEPGSDRWQRVSFDFSSDPYCLTADPHTPGRFYLSVKDEGLYRSDDGGASWREVYDAPTSFVSVDAQQPGRLMAGITGYESPRVSYDDGETWLTLDDSLPGRGRNMGAFSGERLVVGTGGNGVFWTRLPAR